MRASRLVPHDPPTPDFQLSLQGARSKLRKTFEELVSGSHSPFRVLLTETPTLGKLKESTAGTGK